jgi:hypothetical protein
VIAKHLTRAFGLEARDVSRAIDRTLGGVVRAAHRQSKFCPDPARDPIAWHSFKKASHNYYFVQDIYHGYSLFDRDGNSVKIKPRIYADFNGIERGGEEDWLLLDGRGTLDDLNRIGLEFQEGEEALFYDDDEDDEGNPDDIQAEGVMKYHAKYKWVAVIEWDKIHHASDRSADK